MRNWDDDTIEGMASIAANEMNSAELRSRMYAELAQYIYPKRKAVEHGGISGDPLTIHVCYKTTQSRGEAHAHALWVNATFLTLLDGVA